MRNIESVACSFEKTADDLEGVPNSTPLVSDVVQLRASLRLRAQQVRNGQVELDKAKGLLATLKESAR